MKGYTRVYRGGIYPVRFYSVGWCKPEELEKALKEGWLIGTKNLFGPDGQYPREEPKTK